MRRVRCRSSELYFSDISCIVSKCSEDIYNILCITNLQKRQFGILLYLFNNKTTNTY